MRESSLSGIVVSCFVLFWGACTDDPASEQSTDTDTYSTSDSDADSDPDTRDTDSTATGETDPGNIVRHPLFPHDVGNQWTYRYVALTANPEDAACAPGDWDAEILSMDNTTGVEIYLYVSPCVMDMGQYNLEMTFDGDHTDVLTGAGIATPGTVFTEVPVEDGFAWTSGAGSVKYYHWVDAGTITVEAGVFTDCWNRVETDGPGGVVVEEMIFCRGIGRIFATKPGGYQSELIDYHLVGQ